MTNFNQMRQNMILGQFLPGLIKDSEVLNHFEEFPREQFLPENLRDISYSDLNIKIGQYRYIPSPFNTAQIFQEAKFKGNEVALLIGANYGYEAAIASKMVDTLIALEQDKNIKVVAQENLKKFNIENVVLISDNHERGYKKLGPYDIIISIDTSIIVKQELLEQIAEGGKLMFCEKLTFGMKESKLNVFYKQNNKYIKENLFDLNIPSQNNSDTINNQFDFN